MSNAVPAVAADWRQALNPPIYLVSVLPGLGVPLIAADPALGLQGLLLATVAVVLLQHAINLFNDAADWRLGADVEKFDSWVRVHDQQPRLAVRHGTISLLAGGLLGLLVLWQQAQWWILWIATPLLLLGYLYNAGPRPLAYTHLGEWVTGICYGPGVFGCLWLVAGGTFDSGWLAGSIAFAALAMALLLSHQPPQVDTDRAAGKRSFAVRYGANRTRQSAIALFVIFVAALGAGLAVDGRVPAGALLGLSGAALALWVWRDGPNPKRILMAATTVVGGGLLLGMIA